MKRNRYLAAAAVLLLASACSQAQSMQDPTRPAPLPAAGEGATDAVGPQLQSVLVSRQPGGRHVAVIDGDTVRLGEQYRGARVVRITQTEVELARGKERQVLRLPAAEKVDGSVKPVARPR